MASLDKFDKFNRKISMGIEWVGLAALILMMLITTIDVISAKLFLRPVYGALDIMMLAQLVAISFAVAATLILGQHVKVEFFVALLPERVQAVIECIVFLLGLLLFVLIVWRLFLYGYDLQTGGEVSSTARIPFHPFAYGVAIACIPVCLVYFSFFIRSILRVLKR